MTQLNLRLLLSNIFEELSLKNYLCYKSILIIENSKCFLSPKLNFSKLLYS